MNSLLPYIIILVVGILIGSGVVTAAILREKNTGYIEVSGQRYKLVPVEVVYVEKHK